LLCLLIRNGSPRAAGHDRATPFALLTDTQRPLRIGKQSKGPRTLTLPAADPRVAYR